MERKKINGKYVNDMGCCGIFAAAIVMGLEPEDVFNDYKRRFKKRGNWKGSTYRGELSLFMREKYGSELDLEEHKNKTVARFAATADPSYTYLVYIRGHAMVLSKGRLIDQNHDEDWRTMRHSGKKLEYTYKVLNGAELPDTPVSGPLTTEERAEEVVDKLIKYRDELKKISEKLGIDIEKMINISGNEYELVGYKKSAKKYPFLVINKKTNEFARMSKFTVIRNLSKAA